MRDGLFFIHGGPGFNSIPEAAVLGPLLKRLGTDAFFWNEPSPLRSKDHRSIMQQSFPNWLDSLESEFKAYSNQRSKVVVVGFSFGSHGAVSLARKYASKISDLILIAPSLDLHSVFKNICELSVRDFRETAPDKSDKIRRLLAQSRTVMDGSMESAFMVALENAGLLVHYWLNPKKMQEWVQLSSSPEAQFDLGSFFGVSRTFTEGHLTPSGEKEARIRVHLLFGTADPIVRNVDREIALARALFSDVRAPKMVEAGHFLHLERPEEFINIVNSVE